LAKAAEETQRLMASIEEAHPAPSTWEEGGRLPALFQPVFLAHGVVARADVVEPGPSTSKR
jgi:hypothetical protein